MRLAPPSEPASQPVASENAAPIFLAERNERAGVHGLVGPGRLRAPRAGLADGLEEREGEHLDLGRGAGAGSGDDALAARRKIHEAAGEAHPGRALTVRFERREE